MLIKRILRTFGFDPLVQPVIRRTPGIANTRRTRITAALRMGELESWVTTLCQLYASSLYRACDRWAVMPFWKKPAAGFYHESVVIRSARGGDLQVFTLNWPMLMHLCWSGLCYRTDLLAASGPASGGHADCAQPAAPGLGRWGRNVGMPAELPRPQTSKQPNRRLGPSCSLRQLSGKGALQFWPAGSENSGSELSRCSPGLASARRVGRRATKRFGGENRKTRCRVRLKWGAVDPKKVCQGAPLQADRRR